MRKNTPANKTGALHQSVLHTHTHSHSWEFIVNVISFDARAHAEMCSAGKSKWNQELGGLGSVAERLHTSRSAGQSCHMCIAVTPLAWFWLAAGIQPRCFTYFAFAMKSHFANQMHPSTDLATVFDFCSHYWECPLAQHNQGELVCLLRSSKHLWVANKNTQGATHPELMRPRIPLLATDQVSSGWCLAAALCPSYLSLHPLSAFFFFFKRTFNPVSSKPRKEPSAFLLSNYRAFAVNYFY